MRFRLLECRFCHERTWSTDNQPVHPPGNHCHEWWERFTFHAESNGPGLHPIQVAEPVAVSR